MLKPFKRNVFRLQTIARFVCRLRRDAASGQVTLTTCDHYYYYCYYLKPTSTKLQAEILTLNKVNDCNDVSFGDHSVLKEDRIPPLKSHGQALEEELCFPGVLSDNCDASANHLLRHFYGCLMPRTCCFYGKRTEDVGAGQLGVFYYYYYYYYSKLYCASQ